METIFFCIGSRKTTKRRNKRDGKSKHIWNQVDSVFKELECMHKNRKCPKDPYNMTGCDDNNVPSWEQQMVMLSGCFLSARMCACVWCTSCVPNVPKLHPLRTNHGHFQKDLAMSSVGGNVVKGMKSSVCSCYRGFFLLISNIPSILHNQILNPISLSGETTLTPAILWSSEGDVCSSD